MTLEAVSHKLPPRPAVHVGKQELGERRVLTEEELFFPGLEKITLRVPEKNLHGARMLHRAQAFASQPHQEEGAHLLRCDRGWELEERHRGIGASLLIHEHNIEELVHMVLRQEAQRQNHGHQLWHLPRRGRQGKWDITQLF